MKKSIELTPEQLDLLLESEEKPPLAVTRQRALSLPSVYANVELISIP